MHNFILFGWTIRNMMVFVSFHIRFCKYLKSFEYLHSDIQDTIENAFFSLKFIRLLTVSSVGNDLKKKLG